MAVSLEGRAEKAERRAHRAEQAAAWSREQRVKWERNARNGREAFRQEVAKRVAAERALQEGEDEDTKGEGKICDAYPWEHNELVCRELLNCFGTKLVVHHNTNCSWPLACARDCIRFLGFARNDTHAEHIRRALVAMVVAEIIEGKNDGFRNRRFISRQRSLAGSTEEPSKMEDGEREIKDESGSVKTHQTGDTNTQAGHEPGLTDSDPDSPDA